MRETDRPPVLGEVRDYCSEIAAADGVKSPIPMVVIGVNPSLVAYRPAGYEGSEFMTATREDFERWYPAKRSAEGTIG